VAELRTVVLCDYVRPEGALAHVLGANIDTINAPQVPIGVNLGLFAIVAIDAAESGVAQELRLTIRPADRTEHIFELTAAFSSGVNEEGLPDYWHIRAPVCLNFGVPFAEYGYYVVDVRLNDGEPWTSHLRVVATSAA
jgi:hypothetical protein